MLALERHDTGSSIEKPLFELVKIRGAQINGGAFCLDLHAQDARAAGETESRLYALSAWRDTPCFTDRERAALSWTEALTLLAVEKRVSTELFDATRQHFTEAEIVDLTLGVIAINGWNRIAIAFDLPAGSYRPVTRSSPA